ncbi:MAG: hypothetical protein R3321_10525 [Nitrososphaeraceae archaeon]|nr:hypothetical protein [Nitrososphaeraceae archaeon]
MKKKNILRVIIIVMVVLIIPLLAMQFTEEVDWSLFDFIVAGILLSGLGFGIELIVVKAQSFGKRLVFILLLLFMFLLIWAELAVGIFGTPFAGS